MPAGAANTYAPPYARTPSHFALNTCEPSSSFVASSLRRRATLSFAVVVPPSPPARALLAPARSLRTPLPLLQLLLLRTPHAVASRSGSGSGVRVAERVCANSAASLDATAAASIAGASMHMVDGEAAALEGDVDANGDAPARAVDP